MKQVSHLKRRKKLAGCPEEAAFLELCRTTDVLGRRLTALLKAEDLSATQYNVLRILRGALDGLACGETGNRMITRDPDITRLLDRMEKRSLITRKRQSDDRRVVKTFITPQGLELLKILDRPVSALHKRQFQDIAPAKLKVLAAMLEEIRSQQAGREADCDSRSGAANKSKQNDSK